MLIKYKTEPTIIVLSPNSANLIKILTQFVYSINIRYFSPSSLPCPVTLQGITYKIGAEAKGKYISSSAVPRSITGCFVQQNIGEVSHSDGGVEKTAAITKSNLNLSPCVAKPYRGSARRARGLKKTLSKKFLVIFLNPSPQELSFLRSLPYTANAAQRRRLNTSYLTDKNHIIKEYLKTPPLPCPAALRGVLRSKI